MDIRPHALVCDGCGLPASADHIADRLRRLELSTKYRPIHINTLLVSLAPPARLDDDFYSSSAPRERYAKLFESLEIASNSGEPGSASQLGDDSRMLEFQRKGYYLAYLSECPRNAEDPLSLILTRLAPTFVRRIRFNYKPKAVALLGEELLPLVETLKGAGIGQIQILDHGQRTSTLRTARRD